MRFLLIILAVAAVCYVLLIGIPPTPGDIQLVKFFKAMTLEIKQLVDHFSLMPNPFVKLTIVAGAAFIVVGFFRQLVR